MKRYLFASALAAMALASCSSDDYIGNTPGNSANDIIPKEISFGGETGKISRADESSTTKSGTAADAKKLTYRFWVYGVKHTSTSSNTDENDAQSSTSTPTSQMVYNNYLVEYTNSSTSKQDGTSSATTTSRWEYNNLNNSKDTVGTNKDYNYTTAIKDAYNVDQSTKYWDYSTDSYTFTAFSAKPADLNGTDPKINIEKSNDGYKIKMKSGTSTDNLYFADKVEVKKDGYNKPVQFTFRSVLAKVRVAMYSTIPGYNVKIDKFYSGTDQNTESTDKFKANVTNTPFSADGKTEYTVTYESDKHAILNAPTSTSSDANNARTRGEEAAGGSSSSSTSTTTSSKEVIELGSNLTSQTSISTDKSKPTYDQSEGAYTYFLAQENNSSEMKIKVDYTLTSTDGSKETIKVSGATVTVAADNLKWKVNHAYTYVFKLSENTNGSTGGSSVGLFPITFDAVVAEEGNNNSSNEFEIKKDTSSSTTGGSSSTQGN